MLYLADCYMKTGQKPSALAALGTAKRMNFDPVITEEALFYHGKLAYELNLPKEAVISLQALPVSSRYRVQAQNLIADIVTNLRDYEMATSVLDNIPDKTPEILQAYQKSLSWIWSTFLLHWYHPNKGPEMVYQPP